MHVVFLLVLVVNLLPGLLGDPHLSDAGPGPVLDGLVSASSGADQSFAGYLEKRDLTWELKPVASCLRSLKILPILLICFSVLLSKMVTLCKVV